MAAATKQLVAYLKRTRPSDVAVVVIICSEVFAAGFVRHSCDCWCWCCCEKRWAFQNEIEFVSWLMQIKEKKPRITMNERRNVRNARRKRKSDSIIAQLDKKSQRVDIALRYWMTSSEKFKSRRPHRPKSMSDTLTFGNATVLMSSTSASSRPP